MNAGQILTAQFYPSGNQFSVIGYGSSGWQISGAAYDSNDHLTQFSNATSGSLYFNSSYYADGLRMWRQPAATGARTYFLYDSGPIPIAEFDQTGKVIAYNTVGVNGLLSRAVGARRR